MTVEIFFIWFSKCCGWCFRIFIFQQLMSSFLWNCFFLLFDCRLFAIAFTLDCFAVRVWNWVRNGNIPAGIPCEWESNLNLEMWMARNGNWLHGNGREWECNIPFPVISTLRLCVDYVDNLSKSCHVMSTSVTVFNRYSSSQRALPHRYENSHSHAIWNHTGSYQDHSVTCHPAEVTFPPLPQPIKLVLDLAPQRDARLSWPSWLVIYGYAISARNGHPSQY